MKAVSVPAVTARTSRAVATISARGQCFIRSWTIFTPARTAASAHATYPTFGFVITR